MKQSVLRLLSLVMLPGLAGAASFTPLGYLADGNPGSYAFAVSDDGSVVVGYDYNGGSSDAWRWTGGVFTGLGDLCYGCSHPNTQPQGVSADGSVVVGRAGQAGFDPGVAFRSTGGVMTGLGVLYPGGAFTSSQANGVSADGSIVVGRSTTNGEGTQAFRWTGGVMTGLGFLPGGVSSNASNVSADGTVIVGTSYGNLGHEAFRWTGGVMTGLGFLPGGIYSDADSVSTDGSVVVGEGTSTLGTQAFRWTSGVMTGLGDLPGGIFQSNATGVSADGSVVVGIGSSPGDVSESFVWTEASGMERLFDVLVARGATGLTDWTLMALGISGDGNWVVGYGSNPSGNPEAFLANIAPAVVPIPPAVWLFGSALGAMGWLRRKTT